MILRFACVFLGVLGLFAFYEIGVKEWFSWVTLAGSILFISHALNPKWSDRIVMWFMNTVFNAGLEPIDQACANGNMKMVSGYLKAKSDPNITNENQLTLLALATLQPARLRWPDPAEEVQDQQGKHFWVFFTAKIQNLPALINLKDIRVKRIKVDPLQFHHWVLRHHVLPD